MLFRSYHRRIRPRQSAAFAMHPTLKTLLHSAVDNCLRRVPIVLYSGAAGSMLVAGDERWSRYLPDRFFGSGPRERRLLGHAWTWQLPRSLRRWRDAADVTVARVDAIASALFPTDEYLQVSEWIRMVAPVPASDEDFTSRDARTATRAVLSNGLTWSISHNLTELESYIVRDYEPYTRRRYGADAYTRPRRLLRTAFAKGGLLWVENERVPIAGVLFEVADGSFVRWTTACVEANEQVLRQRGLDATYLFGFHAARSQIGRAHV